MSDAAYPFWPRRSPHFAAVRAALRPWLRQLDVPVAVGLSGGPDSLALAAALAAEQHPGAQAVCINHGLQPGSRALADAACAHAARLGLPGIVVDVVVDPEEIARSGMEAAARRARYQAFAQQRRPVLIAHTAEDQSETLLLGLLRGQAAGLRERAEVEGADIVRPLLALRRADTEGACAELGLEPWRDPHNDNTDFRRVGVRRDIIPALAQLVGGDVVPALAAAAEDAAADSAAWDGEVSRRWDEVASASGLECAEVAKLPWALRRRVVARWLRESGVEVTRAAVEAVSRLCTDWHGQGGVAVRAAQGNSLPANRIRLEVVRVGGKLALLHL